MPTVGIYILQFFNKYEKKKLNYNHEYPQAIYVTLFTRMLAPKQKLKDKKIHKAIYRKFTERCAHPVS